MDDGVLSTMFSTTLRNKLKPRYIQVFKRFIEEASDPPLGESLWLKDIKRYNLVAISKQLGSEYLAETKALPKFPVKGLIYSNLPNELYVNIHGYENIPVTHDFGNEKLRDINILGWRFFDETSVFEVVDKNSMTVTLYNNIDVEKLKQMIEKS